MKSSLNNSKLAAFSGCLSFYLFSIKVDKMNTKIRCERRLKVSLLDAITLEYISICERPFESVSAPPPEQKIDMLLTALKVCLWVLKFWYG